MNTDKIIMEGLTYDDVLLIPARSEVLPREVDIQTRFTRDIPIHVPIVSAAMDTVTDAKGVWYIGRISVAKIKNNLRKGSASVLKC